MNNFEPGERPDLLSPMCSWGSLLGEEGGRRGGARRGGFVMEARSERHFPSHFEDDGGNLALPQVAKDLKKIRLTM